MLALNNKNKLWSAFIKISSLSVMFALVVLLIYSVLFYTMVTCQYNFDFTSFYSATLAIVKGHNPYDAWIADYLPFIKKAPINLNPPLFLLLFSPFGFLSYKTAMAVWLILSFGFGLMGAWIAFYYAFSRAFIKKYGFILFAAYLALFGTLMNYSIAQVGTVLVFLIMLGYHFYLQKKDYLAAIFWGLIIALKFFPALLFLLVLKQRRFKLCVMMGGMVVLCFLLPLLYYDVTIYHQFYKAMTSIGWYHNSWNASVLGFIHRGIKDFNRIDLIMPIYASVFGLFVMAYSLSLGPATEGNSVNHQPFCLTLVMMLILSPLGWLYYFPMLIFPLCLLWAKLMEEKEALSSKAQVWLVALFLINFPVNNHSMNSEMVQVKLSSFYFFGLLLLAYLLIITKRNLSGNNDVIINAEKQSFLLLIFIILAFGLIIPGTGFLLRLATACVY